MESVYWAARTGSLSIIQVNILLWEIRNKTITYIEMEKMKQEMLYLSVNINLRTASGMVRLEKRRAGIHAGDIR